MRRIDSAEKFKKFVELRQAKLAGESTKAEKLTTELQL
jgi:hypothetical protein